jgi:putative ABC transport system ATP-binding protein
MTEARSQDSLETISRHHHRSPYEYFRILFHSEAEDFRVVTFYALGVGVLSLVLPIGVQSLVNSVAFGAILQPVAILSLLVLLGMGLSGAFSLAQILVIELLQQRLFVRVALDLARRIPFLSLAASKREYAPQLMNRFFEVVIVQKAISKLLLDGISLALQATIGLLILAFYHPVLLAFSITLIVIVLFVLFAMGRGAFRTSQKESTAKHGVLVWLENLAGSPILFKDPYCAQFGLAQADASVAEYLSYRKKHFRIVFRQYLAFFSLQAVAGAALLGIGGVLVIEQTLTLGQLVASELIVSGVLTGITKFAKMLETLYDMVASLSKLDSLLDIPLESVDGEELPRLDIPAAVTFKDVGFHDAGRVVLRSISASFPPGSRNVVIGANSSGKSLLGELLYELAYPTSGVIEIDGHNLIDIRSESIRRQVGLVRGIEVFRGTIEENLRLGRSDLSLKDVRTVLEGVGLLGDVEKLPEQLNTILGEDSWPLSKGQAYRLMIARAIIHRPRLLIIDEAIDSFDPTALERSIIPAICCPQAPWTLIVLTHNPALAGLFDRSFYLTNQTLTLQEEAHHG